MTIGSATKAAVARIAGALPYLYAEGAAAPTAQRDFLTSIQSKYAASHTTKTGVDPKLEAAAAWAEEELTKALEQDGEQPEPEVEPAAEEASDEELERLTAPDEKGGQ